MPFYNYKCDTCGNTFEYKQKISENALTKCPAELCEEVIKGSGEVHRMISKNVGIIFNGSGFYQTDYVKKPSSTPKTETPAKSESTPNTQSSTKAETSTKTESTPAAKSSTEKCAS
jgi:putative FmdB family regulatory protein